MTDSFVFFPAADLSGSAALIKGTGYGGINALRLSAPLGAVRGLLISDLQQCGEAETSLFRKSCDTPYELRRQEFYEAYHGLYGATAMKAEMCGEFI